ncbi:MAG: transglycosylase SLT domain-containing protein [Verrucomicrobiota bacterium]|nr:transglycosylase SLT domain-containing protein [Verrucomicrobiota bacterium]
MLRFAQNDKRRSSIFSGNDTQVLLIISLTVFTACARHHAPPQSSPPTRAEIWAAIQPQAQRYRLDPAFIYALVAAESNFEPRARSGSACGLLQLKPAAWAAVSSAPFEPTVWDWRANLEAGVDYLAFCRSYLHRQPRVEFSYPLLLSAFHYGLDYVEQRQFDVRRLICPDNVIYRELWGGHLRPVEPPR